MPHTKLKELAAVRTTRSRTMELVDGLEQDDLDSPVAPGVWSVGEVLDHLILSDQVYRREIEELFRLKASGARPYLKRSFADIDAAILFIPKVLLPLAEIPFNIMNAFLPRAVRNFVISSRLIPTQAPEVAKPRPGRPLESLWVDLKAGPDQMEQLFSEQPSMDYTECIHYHPLLGENNLVDLLRFITNHEAVHQKQIEELVATLRN